MPGTGGDGWQGEICLGYLLPELGCLLGSKVREIPCMVQFYVVVLVVHAAKKRKQKMDNLLKQK